jgi:hypothetical protein
VIGWILPLHCGRGAHDTIPFTMSQAPDPRRYSSQSKRPASIAELAERALDNLWDENKDLKHYLRVAEKYRRDGKEFVRTGDLENGFVQFARAATLVLEKLPLHRDYYTLLKPAQRQNLGLVRVYLSAVSSRCIRVYNVVGGISLSSDVQREADHL